MEDTEQTRTTKELMISNELECAAETRNNKMSSAICEPFSGSCAIYLLQNMFDDVYNKPIWKKRNTISL